MSRKDNILIGEILISEGVITREQLEAGLKSQRETGDFICTTLIKMGAAPEEKILGILARHLKIAYVRLEGRRIEAATLAMVPARFATHYKIMPLEFKDNVLVLAMTNPLDVRTLDDLRMLLDIDVCGVLAGEKEIQGLMHAHYGVGAETLEKMMERRLALDVPQEKTPAEDLEAMAADASIVKFVNQILAQALKERATDIHLEPFQDELRTRFRIDSILYDINIPDSMKYFHSAIVSRVKIMAGLNIAERRLPQDGRIKIRVEDRDQDLRVSVLPTVFGEAVQIRILSPSLFLSLENIGFFPPELAAVEGVIAKPHGIIFVTGPTGSGKSTTLYACLSRLNSSERKIITIEDPVEYQMRGVNQIQVLPQIGFNFATALRHMLRHDPDVMMVGEVRDVETAEIAIRSALTGHLVFSTLHTNDASGAAIRLLDMGIEPFLVSSSLECLIAQRLLRLICPQCRQPVAPNVREEIMDRLKKDAPFLSPPQEFYEGRGCPPCRMTGYQGRTAIHEVLIVTEPIRELILTRAASHGIKQAAVGQGMRTLRQNGLQKMAQGLTTFAEVMRVTQEEDVP